MPTQRVRNAVPSASRTTPRYPALDSRRFAIRLAFDGTTYQGFQSQPYKNTIQDQVENRLRGLLKRDVKVMAWGRTDAGVHATGGVATVDLTAEEVERFALRNQPTTANDEASDEGDCDDATMEQRAAAFLRSVLKEFACRAGETPMPQTRYGSISARNVVPVPSDFDARYSAKWKRYVYYVCAGGEFGEGLPFAWSRHAWHVRQNLDADLMQQAAALIDGEHDFTWMSVVQPGERRDPRRRVKLTVEKVPMQTTGGDSAPYFAQRPASTKVYKIACTCDFFLYKMVRRLVGIVVALGKRDASVDELRACLDAYDKDGNGEDDASRTKMQIPPKLLQTAPAKGLCLEHIDYDIPI